MIEDKNCWEIAPGEYKVWAGGSSRDLPLSATISLNGEVALTEGEAHR